uniref:Uncharacterized protein n=1 Tax=Eutreptiella gymnastica TaxID=73025 RepID=A0A7S1N569_9EUGL
MSPLGPGLGVQLGSISLGQWVMGSPVFGGPDAHAAPPWCADPTDAPDTCVGEIPTPGVVDAAVSVLGLTLALVGGEVCPGRTPKPLPHWAVEYCPPATHPRPTCQSLLRAFVCAPPSGSMDSAGQGPIVSKFLDT